RLSYQALDVSDLRGGGVEKLFGLVDVKTCGDTAIAAQSSQPQTVFRGVAGFAGDFQLQVQLAKLEIARGDVGQQSRDHAAPGLGAGQVLGSSGFGETPQPAPYVELPTEREACLRVAYIGVEAGRKKPE